MNRDRPPDADADAGARIAGWYGKLPCLGDFASRRLPTEFISTWDRWLQRAIAGSRERLRERWLDAFLASPMWRFMVGSGVCGETAWTGLLVPSVDRVGRYFPLTLALPVPVFALSDAIWNQSWYAELERIALSALRVDCALDAFEDAIAGNPLTLDRRTGGAVEAPGLATWLRSRGATPLRLRFGSPEALASAMHGSAGALLSESFAGRSFWWYVEHGSGAIELHCTGDLPDADRYTLLLRPPPASGDSPMFN